MLRESDHRPINVLHVPCNTPYIEKLKGSDFAIVDLSRAGLSRRTPTYQSILDCRDRQGFWDSFDVCHLHYGFEFERLETITAIIKILQEHSKPIVYTCHELESVHGVGKSEYEAYLDVILANSLKIITLTQAAKKSLIGRNGVRGVTVIPHGKVCDPIDCPRGDVPEVMFFGPIRHNCDHVTSLVNTILGTSPEDCRITWLTRPFTPEGLTTDGVSTVLQCIMNDARTKVEATLPLPDGILHERLGRSDVLVMPYTSAGHSGQLELAFDLGILPVTTKVGFLDAQLDVLPAEYAQAVRAVSADWSDGKSWMFQERLMDAVRRAIRSRSRFGTLLDAQSRRDFRDSEHLAILNAHSEVYHSLVTECTHRK